MDLSCLLNCRWSCGRRHHDLFFWGLADGSVSSFNFGIWLVALVLVAVVLVAGVGLANRGHLLAASFVLGILGIPGILSALFILLFALSGEKFI